MSKLSKKVASVGLSLTTAIWLSGAAMIVPATAVGQTTIEDLQAQIATLLAQITALQAQLVAQGGTAAPVATTSCTFTRDLTVGAKGDDVMCLQQYLNTAGHTLADSGPGSPGNETMYFGSLTKAGVSKWQAANNVSPAVGYFGPISRSKYTAVAATAPVVTPGTPATPTTPGVVIPASGINIAVTADSPEKGRVPPGATGVPFLKFTVAGNGTLNNLTFERKGIGATADFGSGGFYIYEGPTRLTTGKSINSTTHEVSFASLNLSVSGVRTLTFVADIASGASSANEHQFNLISAAGTSDITGLPVRGTLQDIGGQSVGGIVLATSTAPVNPNVGQVGALFLEFTVTASSTEDIEVKRLTFTEGGSVANEKISNLVLKDGNDVLGTIAAVSADDTFVIDFAAPILIEKGQQKTWRLYGDIDGTARRNDTIDVYIENNSDVEAIGSLYGYPVTPTITSIDSTDDVATLTIQGGQVTITFNGPVAGDIARRGQDVTVFDFTIASENQIEIRNLRLHASTTGMDTDEGFTDFKLWDVATNAVISSATDVTTSTEVIITDTINIAAGESKRMKVTVDVDADNDDGDDITVSISTFNSSDIKNLDNNSFVNTADIVPNARISGNVQDTRVPELNVQLAASPTSQTYVRGTTDIALVGFSVRAISDDIRITTIKISATSTSGTLDTGETFGLALYEGTTKISDTKSLSSATSLLEVSFDNMDYTVMEGDTKVITVRGNISSDAGNDEIYAFRIQALTDLTTYESSGNSITPTGTTANSGNTVAMTVADVGGMDTAVSPEDSETQAGIVVGGKDQVLAKFRFTATNEAMSVERMQLLVNDTNSATVTSTAAADEVPTVKLYDGTTLLGTYSVTGSGEAAGIVFIDDLGWSIPKDTSKTMTVKGTLAAVESGTNGADTGASVYVHIVGDGGPSEDFIAQGATARDTAVTASSGNEKVVYKTAPTFSLPTQSYTLAGGTVPIFKFRITADSKEQITWKKVQFYVSMTGATMSAVDAAPSTTGNVRLTDVTGGGTSLINIATAFSGSTTSTSGTAAITGGNAGYVTLVLNTEQAVPAGQARDYEVDMTFTDLSATSGNSYALIRVYREEAALVSATPFGNVEDSDGVTAGDTNGAPSFIWSDFSATSHSETTADWANGRYIIGLPTVQKQVKN